MMCQWVLRVEPESSGTAVTVPYRSDFPLSWSSSGLWRFAVLCWQYSWLQPEQPYQDWDNHWSYQFPEQTATILRLHRSFYQMLSIKVRAPWMIWPTSPVLSIPKWGLTVQPLKSCFYKTIVLGTSCCTRPQCSSWTFIIVTVILVYSDCSNL